MNAADHLVIPSTQRVIFLPGFYDRYRFIQRPEICNKFIKMMQEVCSSAKSEFGGVQAIIGRSGMGKTFLVH